MKLFFPQIDYLVDSVTTETPDVTRLTLKPASEHKVLWQAGQYITLSFNNRHRWSQERSFSIANSPNDDGVIELAFKHFGPYTDQLAQIASGNLVRISGAYGSFGSKRLTARKILFLAGGIGITPLLSMIRAFAAEQSTAEITLIYANRTAKGATFRDELPKLSANLPNFRYKLVEGTVTPDILIENAGEIADLDQAYICGPQGFMSEMSQQLRSAKLPQRKIITEAFTLGPGRFRGPLFWTSLGVYLLVAIFLSLVINSLGSSPDLMGWYQTRASGLVSGLLLITIALSGISLSVGWSFRFIAPLYAWTVHKAIGISLLATSILHALNVLRTPLYRLDILNVILPLGPLKYALGTVTLYGVIIIVLSSLSLLPKRHRPWKVTHFLAYVAVIAVFAHSWLAGTDLLKPAVKIAWLIALVTVALFSIWRLSRVGAVRNGLWRKRWDNKTR